MTNIVTNNCNLKLCGVRMKKKTIPYLVKCKDRRYRYQRYVPKEISWCWKSKVIVKAFGTNNTRDATTLCNDTNNRIEKIFTDCKLRLLTPSESKNAILDVVLFDEERSSEKTLKEACIEYISQHGTRWKAKGLQEFWCAIDKVQQFTNNKPPRLIDDGIMTKVRNNLAASGCSQRTVNKYLSRVSAVFTFCVKKKWMQFNPVPSVVYDIPVNAVKQAAYKPFDDKDIKQIFEEMLADENIYGPRYCSYMYWLPLLGAFTGARLGDLCNLTKGSLEKRAGIWILNIENQKTGDLPRPVPIHNKLLDLGFLEFVESLVDSEKLFKVYQRKDDGQFDYKWWYANQRDYVQDPLKVFHSWRTTVSTRLNNKGVTATWRADILGHERPTNVETDKNYTTDTEILALHPAINLLEYPLVDWGKVKAKQKIKPLEAT